MAAKTRTRQNVLPGLTPDDPIQARFEAFDREHPEIYRAFRSTVRRFIRMGARHVGAKNVFEYLRFKTALSGRGKGEPFKVNNVYVSRYVRKLVNQHPELARYFETRALRAAS